MFADKVPVDADNQISRDNFSALDGEIVHRVVFSAAFVSHDVALTLVCHGSCNHLLKTSYQWALAFTKFS